MKKYVCSILTVLCITFGFGAFAACEGNEPPEYVILETPTGVRMEDFWILTWDEVEDAEVYVVSWGNGETYETKKNRLNMSFLELKETYTVSVYAKGGIERDGMLFLDSYAKEIVCTMPEASDGLIYTLIEDGAAYEVSAGETFSSDTLILPTYHEDGLPIIRIAKSAFEANEVISAVRFSQKLESIGRLAFTKTNIDEAVFPISLQLIEHGAFGNCENLLQIQNLPKTVEERAFAKTAIQELVIDERTEYIGEKAFAGCDFLSTVIMPTEPPDFGAHVFNNSLWEKKQPKGFIYFGKTLYRHKGDFPNNTHLDLGELPIDKVIDKAFSDCKGLTSVKIPANVQFGTWVFYSCEDLTTVQFAQGVTHIPDRTFYDCTNLANIEFSDELTEIGKGAFECVARSLSFWGKALTLILPKDLIKIGDGAFDATFFSDIVFPEKNIALGRIFRHSSQLRSISIPDNVVSLDGTFYSCANMRWIVLPKDIKVLSADTFEGTRIEKIFIRGTQEECLQWLAENADTMEAYIAERQITVYAYSEDPPTEDGNYWHYDIDGVTPIAWE